MKRKLAERLVVQLTRVADALEAQAAVMAKSQARVEEQIAKVEERRQEQRKQMERLFGDQQVLPGEEPGEFLVLDPDDDTDKTTH